MSRLPCAVAAVAVAARLPRRRHTAAAQDDGIPVESELVRAKCGSCHTADEQKRMTRISYRRATPENWEQTIKRMITLNNVDLEPAEARAILKYLADHHGLAPEEATAGARSRPSAGWSTSPTPPTRKRRIVCSSCHSIGRVSSERRTKEEWELLLAMHRGYYPLVDNQPMNGGQGFRRTRAAAPEPAADGRPPDTRHPMDRVIAHLVEDVSAADAGVDGVVGRHAAAEAGRTLGDLRLSAPARDRSTGR